MAEAADEVARSAWLRKSMQGWLVSQATWPTNLEEYALAHFFILSFFVLLTSLADYGVHHVQRRLQPPEEERPRMTLGLLMKAKARLATDRAPGGRSGGAGNSLA